MAFLTGSGVNGVNAQGMSTSSFDNLLSSIASNPKNPIATPSPATFNLSTIQNPFTVGGFLLVGMEIPQNLDSVGGEQRLAIHEFPGGVRTIQSLGAFPPDVIKWDGIFLGSNAWERAYAFDRFRIDGQKIELSFGSWKFNGKIESFHVFVKHEWYATYHIEFVPSSDLSSPPPPPNTSQAVSQLKQAFAGLASNIPSTIFGDLLPSSISNALNGLLGVGQTALSVANGVLSAVDPSALQQINFYADTALSAGNAILSANSAQGLTLSMASSIIHTLSYAGVIQNVFTTSSALQTTLQLINPNLISLATEFYNDPSQWLTIAQYNGLTDPLPQGQYAISIPQIGPTNVVTGRFN
jgi:hypothetical protein